MRGTVVCVPWLVLVGGGAVASDLDVSGKWVTPDHASVVEIRDCGDGTPCGVVVAVDPTHGGMVCDENNRDARLRGRDMVGVTLLHGFKDGDGRGVWQRGAIYNPKDGRTYRARMELISHDALAVSGCLGPICKELIWERAEVSEVAGNLTGEGVASL